MCRSELRTPALPGPGLWSLAQLAVHRPWRGGAHPGTFYRWPQRHQQGLWKLPFLRLLRIINLTIQPCLFMLINARIKRLEFPRVLSLSLRAIHCLYEEGLGWLIKCPICLIKPSQALLVRVASCHVLRLCWAGYSAF